MSAIHKALSAKSHKETPEARHVNRQRVLLVMSRGVTYRHRHFIADLSSMMPHARKEPKFDSKKNLDQLNGWADIYNCNNVMFFEARKHQDLYLWLAKAPNGPTVKFHLQNLHTLDELNFTGNCLKGLRPLLSFDAAFELEPHLRLMKEMLIHALGVPPRARKLKPFFDHVLTFAVVDKKIWVRNFQIQESHAAKESQELETPDELLLLEIGPRFVMTPIVVLEGSFGGPKIYENKEYISPNALRAQARHQEAAAARARQEAVLNRRVAMRNAVLKPDPLLTEALFK